MKQVTLGFPQRYIKALRTHLDQGTALPEAAREVACQAPAAGHVKAAIREIKHHINMSITDDGKSFDVQRVLRSHGKKHLGLPGMRERVEMVGGSFEMESSPGHGTTIKARIPLGKTLKSSKFNSRKSNS